MDIDELRGLDFAEELPIAPAVGDIAAADPKEMSIATGWLKNWEESLISWAFFSYLIWSEALRRSLAGSTRSGVSVKSMKFDGIGCGSSFRNDFFLDKPGSVFVRRVPTCGSICSKTERLSFRLDFSKRVHPANSVPSNVVL